jgi:hypothetical protein
MQGGRDDRSLGELFAELAQETSTLVRQEVTLAKTEVSDRAPRGLHRHTVWVPRVAALSGPWGGSRGLVARFVSRSLGWPVTPYPARLTTGGLW